MKSVTTIHELIALWPSRADLAADIALGDVDRVGVAQVAKWAQRQSIPAKYHFQLLTAAQRRGLPVTAELIVRLHATTPKPGAAA